MKKVILQEFLTLDGMAAASDGNTDFIPSTAQGDQGFRDAQLKMLEDVDTLVLGRKTYELFADFWPHATEGEDRDLAEAINGLNKIVFSNTLDSAPWGDLEPATVISGDATKELSSVKDKSGKNIIIWGSISLVRDLTNGGLIDEYRFVTCPLVLGEGRSFFNEKVDSRNFKLNDSTSFESGLVEARYEPTKTAAKQSAG